MRVFSPNGDEITCEKEQAALLLNSGYTLQKQDPKPESEPESESDSEEKVPVTPKKITVKKT